MKYLTIAESRKMLSEILSKFRGTFILHVCIRKNHAVVLNASKKFYNHKSKDCLGNCAKLEHSTFDSDFLSLWKKIGNGVKGFKFRKCRSDSGKSHNYPKKFDKTTRKKKETKRTSRKKTEIKSKEETKTESREDPTMEGPVTPMIDELPLPGEVPEYLDPIEELDLASDISGEEIGENDNQELSLIIESRTMPNIKQEDESSPFGTYGDDSFSEGW